MDDQNYKMEVIERLTRIETKLNDYETTKKESELARAKVASNEKRIDNIEDKIKWISRLTAGALIGEGIAIIFLFIKKGLNL